MGAPYTSVSVSGYNSNPPADDGTATEANRVKWSTIKTKLPDPLKTALEAMNANVVTATGKLVGGAGLTSTGTTYTIASTDQGKLVRATAGGITITSADATDVGAPFVHALRNESTGDVTFDGNGSQTIDGEASITLVPTEGILVWTDGTNWFTIGRIKRTQVAPQGYLTTVSSATDAINPVPTSDQISKTALVYRPLPAGNLIPIPDGTNFTVREFSELSLSLVANHLASTIYDVFGFMDGSTMRIGTGPAWNNSAIGAGARGAGAGTTELTALKGLLVNNVAITARNGASTYSVAAKCGIYLGSIFIDGAAGQVTCHRSWGQSRKWGVWNAYNRRPIVLKAGDSTASWTYATAVARSSNNAAANKLTVFSGLAEELYAIEMNQRVDIALPINGTGSARTVQFGPGVNSTSVFSSYAVPGMTENGTNAVGSTTSHSTRHILAPSIGINDINALELGNATGTFTFYGAETQMVLSATWMG